MSLFPAYSEDNEPNKQKELVTWSVEEADFNVGVSNVSPAAECRLLASDSESDEAPPPKLKVLPAPVVNEDFYLDTKMDRGNLRVSTLYYPGRPDYKERKPHHTIGLRSSAKRKAPPRYFSTAVANPDDAADIAARTQAIQQMLSDDPRNLALWLQFIRMQEAWVNAETAKTVAEAACSRLPRCIPLHEKRLELMAEALPNSDCIATIRKELAIEKSPRLRLLLWQSLIIQSAKSSGGAEAARGAGGSALADVSMRPYVPILLFTYGSFLSAADLWEQLVQLIELSVALTFPPSPVFPPPMQEFDESKLEEYEDKVISSGLPLSVSWSRVERARAAAHWRPAAPHTPGADPQRRPPPQLAADLLPPVAGDRERAGLCLTLLTLAKVPFLPAYPFRTALAPSPLHCPSTPLLLCLSPSPALPPAHPARPSAPAAANLLTRFLHPPHCYADDDFGFKQWVESLFDAVISWSGELRRVAFISWRLRLLRAKAVVATDLRKLRNEARKLLKGEDHPLLFAELANFELITGEEGYEKAVRAARVCTHAALKLSNNSDIAHNHSLYCARILCQVLVTKSKSSSLPIDGVKALVSAVLRKQIEVVDQEILEQARNICESRCKDLITQFKMQSEDILDSEEQLPDIVDVLLPNYSEWGYVRVLLASEIRREEILKELIGSPQMHDIGAGSQYFSMFGVATATALCERKPQLSKIFHSLFPYAPYIQLLNTDVRVWSRPDYLSHTISNCIEVSSDIAAVAKILPTLLTHLDNEAEAMCISSRILSRSLHHSSSIQHEVRVRSAAGAAATAIHHLPYAKWILVMAASHGSDPADIQALLLERLLRLRVLLDELRPIT